MNKFILFILIFFFCTGIFAQDYLVDGGWVKGKLEQGGYYFLDIQPTSSYKKYHIPEAINAPYELWRTGKQSPQPGMLHNKHDMEAFLSSLGITKSSKIIIVTTGNGASDMATATRVFWSLKIMGINQVSILNGGLISYANEFGGKIERKVSQVRPNAFSTKIDNTLLANIASVKKAIKEKTALLDARSLGEFLGVLKGKSEERSGTIPNSKHLPFDWLVDITGKIRSKNNLKVLFESSGLNPDGDGTIHFCHTGNRAALSWFVDYAILGNHHAKLYDASMSEWALHKELPMTTQINLKNVNN